MGIVEDVADELALESLKIINATGDDAFVQRVADTIGGSSQTMEEAYLTALRVRRAEQRARAVLDQIRKDLPPGTQAAPDE
ncbi:hypothetical protein CEP88_03360 [Roseobacter denitrificans]|uniref:Uncharacterized protein n=1 Tax=Roseobacter denitrificans (strain ATCC 33942 / OCh 114) TaxID=375451 RepID=Q165V2_ROSDO|nr:hypothetical protein [Roseobacter denitrificans]ABG32241.1 hypothetical protein RD1_2702 [Roseobacter denitrificans OCh 114]AVL51736.1 hypothetical protein CEP88_03360 [Roseobacter denitrificans]SFF79184.1 hypothetical protein SAMN05443635_102205 [Roseobacter denitrificans OCh 114]